MRHNFPRALRLNDNCLALINILTHANDESKDVSTFFSSAAGRSLSLTLATFEVDRRIFNLIEFIHKYNQIS